MIYLGKQNDKVMLLLSEEEYNQQKDLYLNFEFSTSDSEKEDFIDAGNGEGFVLKSENQDLLNIKAQEAYAGEIATLDPLLAHILRHERNGEFERAARAESEFEIRQAEIMEKYGRGETVYITETGECYHTTEDCSALANAVGVREINKSDGLKNYSPCSICCN